MNGPCKFKPLAVLDKSTVKIEDVVPSELVGISATG